MCQGLCNIEGIAQKCGMEKHQAWGGYAKPEANPKAIADEIENDQNQMERLRQHQEATEHADCLWKIRGGQAARAETALGSKASTICV